MLAEKFYNRLTLSENTPREHKKAIQSRGERNAALRRFQLSLFFRGSIAGFIALPITKATGEI